MPTAVSVLALRTSPLLKLEVSAPALVARALTVPGQSTVEEFHVTLARLDDLGVMLDPHIVLPVAPATLALRDEVRVVATPTKRACYVEVDDASQALLREYVQACEAVTGLPLLDPARIFHVTLSNAGQGQVRASVGAVWEHLSHAV